MLRRLSDGWVCRFERCAKLFRFPQRETSETVYARLAAESRAVACGLDDRSEVRRHYTSPEAQAREARNVFPRFALRASIHWRRTYETDS